MLSFSIDLHLVFYWAHHFYYGVILSNYFAIFFLFTCLLECSLLYTLLMHPPAPVTSYYRYFKVWLIITASRIFLCLLLLFIFSKMFQFLLLFYGFLFCAIFSIKLQQKLDWVIFISRKGTLPFLSLPYWRGWNLCRVSLTFFLCFWF